MGVFGWIILGGLAGGLASLLTGEKRGCLSNIIIGIVGALLGGFLFSLVGERSLTGRIDLWSVFVAFVGSIILIAFFRAIRGPTVE